MKIAHWSMLNESGMHHVAASMARAELLLGVEARLLDPFDVDQSLWEWALDADLHVSHTHIPERIGGLSFRKSCTKPFRWAFPVHGTPEHVFESSVIDAQNNGYNTGTSYAQHQRGMQCADAVITFWPRHQALYQLATDKHTIVDCLPMGVDREFWAGGTCVGKYAGNPSFLNCESQYPFKWGVYLIRMWPWIREELEEAVLHVKNIPSGTQRFVDMLGARYGSIYGAVYGSWRYGPSDLRNIYKSFDYYISPVRYGDFNRVSMEAGAAGLPVISYPGNEYADFWMHEGDDRMTARDLIAIGKGDVEPRQKLPVPSLTDMGQAAINVYERVLDRAPTQWALGGIPDPLPEPVRDALLEVV